MNNKSLTALIQFNENGEVIAIKPIADSEHNDGIIQEGLNQVFKPDHLRWMMQLLGRS